MARLTTHFPLHRETALTLLTLKMASSQVLQFPFKFTIRLSNGVEPTVLLIDMRHPEKKDPN